MLPEKLWRMAHLRIRVPRRYKLNGATSLGDIAERIQNVTGKPILIKKLAHEISGDCQGLLTRLENTDVVQYSPTISRLHRQQMILHEFAHLIQSEEGWESALSSAPEMAKQSVYSNYLEFHAEAMADLMAAKLRKYNASPHLGLNQQPLHERLIK